MCTSLTFTTDHTYFGRNLDLEYQFGQQVVITPRNYPFSFQAMPTLKKHYAIIGMATVAEDYPSMLRGSTRRASIWQASTSRVTPVIPAARRTVPPPPPMS